jgi:hypothetical protein
MANTETALALSVRKEVVLKISGDPAIKRHTGLPSFELPDGKHSEIIDYNIATFGTNLRP